jgi:hypothetical protein
MVSADQVQKTLADMARNQFDGDEDRVLAFFTRSIDFGVLEGDLSKVILHAIELVDFDRDSMNIVTLDVSKGLVLDRYEEGGEISFGLRLWVNQ